MCPTGTTVAMTAAGTDDTTLAKLHASRAAIMSVLATATEAEAAIEAAGDRIGDLLSSSSPSSSSKLQSKSVATSALRARIDRAVAPAEPLLASLRLVSSLAGEASQLPANPADTESAVAFVDRVDQLRDAIEEAVARGDEAVRRVEEAVGFLGRTTSKAAGRGRVRRLTEAASALRAVYETEAEAMRFEGPLDEALLGLQDLFEAVLLRLKHATPADDAGDTEEYELGTDDEVDAAARMAKTLAGNDCLDICVDIYVKARYRRAAKAMMRLDPAYLKVYTAEAIDGMEWEALESAMALWSPHFHVAIASVLTAERRLCARVLAHLPPTVWPECFAKIAARIVAAFFRFADGVAAAAREPQRLFKLLDMVDAVGRERGRLDALFSGESATLVAIRERTREVERALARAAAAVFYEFGLRVETHYIAGADAVQVPKIVRYAVNYLKCLASDDYRGLMDTALRAERERGGDGNDGDEAVAERGGSSAALAEAVSNVLEALQRHVEAARRVCADAATAHVMAMNAYWYIYMRARGTELAKLIGEEAMKRRYKAAAEEAAWEYQDVAWNPIVRRLGGSGGKTWPPEEAREKAGAFAGALEERVRKHGAEYKIPDGDLRAQIRVAVTKSVRGAYAGFMKANESAVAGRRREFLPVDVIESMVGRVFDEMGDGEVGSVGRTRSSGRARRDSGNVEGFEAN
ncbi:exocyst complex component EXO70I-like [Lolium perenne]|uniref:exocyst complex component EXO70I-like n=1 Tax=Lolium perenne TaxID=4522 RepID=UPI0021EAFFC4|nr:exocyst complex component EXO70I-like [Lolium perenne]